MLSHHAIILATYTTKYNQLYPIITHTFIQNIYCKQHIHTSLAHGHSIDTEEDVCQRFHVLSCHTDEKH